MMQKGVSFFSTLTANFVSLGFFLADTTITIILGTEQITEIRQ